MKTFVYILIVITAMAGCTGVSKQKENVVDAVLGVESTSIVNVDTLKSVFKIDKEYVFFPIDNGKIITNYSDKFGFRHDLVIYDPLRKGKTDTIKLSYYIEELVNYTGDGVTPEAAVFLKNNAGNIKILCRNPWGKSISDLYPANKPKTKIIKTGAYSFNVKNIDEFYYNEEEFQFFMHDTLFDFLENSFPITYDKIESYKRNIHKHFADSTIMYESNFPAGNKMFLVVAADSSYVLYAYNIESNKSKKYVLPSCSNKSVYPYFFYFTNTGFYIDLTYYLEDKEKRAFFSSAYSTWGFIKY